MGGDVTIRATRKAPAQAELRPTCAGASRVTCPHKAVSPYGSAVPPDSLSDAGCDSRHSSTPALQHSSTPTLQHST